MVCCRNSLQVSAGGNLPQLAGSVLCSGAHPLIGCVRIHTPIGNGSRLSREEGGGGGLRASSRSPVLGTKRGAGLLDWTLFKRHLVSAHMLGEFFTAIHGQPDSRTRQGGGDLGARMRFAGGISGDGRRQGGRGRTRSRHEAMASPDAPGGVRTHCRHGRGARWGTAEVKTGGGGESAFHPRGH